MNDRILLANIERLLKEKGISADAVSKAANTPDAVRNLRRRAKGAKAGSWTLDTLWAIAEALKVAPWELLRPPGAAATDRETIRSIVQEELEAAALVQPRKRAK